MSMVSKSEEVNPVINVHTELSSKWYRSINKPIFELIKQYKISNRHKYITDSKGRVNKVEGKLSLNKMDRNINRQRSTGKAENATGDDSGHLIASKLGGIVTGVLQQQRVFNQ